MFKSLSTLQPRNIELETVYITTVNPKIASKLIKELNSLDDLTLTHLKRIRKTLTDAGNILEAILFPASVDIEFVLQFLSRVQESDWVIRTTLVSKLEPMLRIEYEEWKKYWPLSFYERLDLIDKLDQSQEEYASIWTSKIQDFKLQNSNIENIAMIVHPVKNELLALGTDSCLKHPLRHAVMNAIENVALEESKNRNNKNCNNNTKKRSLDEPNYGYLCTGLDIFVFREPCIMCSMALVHSRIHRLFFIKENPENGGICSIYKLHMHNSLNHHFKSYLKV